MGPKKDNDGNKSEKRSDYNHVESIKEITTKHGNGLCVLNITVLFGMAKSTICTVIWCFYGKELLFQTMASLSLPHCLSHIYLIYFLLCVLFLCKIE